MDRPLLVFVAVSPACMHPLLNAPVRTYNVRQPQGREPARLAGFRSTNSRRIDDFKRPDGFYVASSGSGSVNASFNVNQQEPAAEKAQSEKPGSSLLT